jgi:riboflavin synthase
MFTGLIREVGRVAGTRARRGGSGLLLECPVLAPEVREGDSVCVDGACLTVEEPTARGFTAYASGETLEKTTLAALGAGDRVNLEPALRASDALGGHMVQGHVEGVAEVLSLRAAGEGATLEVRLPRDLARTIIPKGSIALSGISLTVAGREGERVSVAAVPVTLQATTILSWKAGTRVNVETDLVGRYVFTYLEGLGLGRGLTVEDLVRKGF